MNDGGDTREDSPAERLRALWRLNKPPDVEALVAGVGSLNPMELATLLRVDQAERWRRGIRTAVEDYLRRFPRLADNQEAVLDLVFNEYLLAESTGGRPDAETFLRRFPQHAETLRLQIDLHLAVAAGSPATVGGVAHASTLIGSWKPLDMPQNFGRYRILGVLGRGGMGTVYLAHDSELDRKVALKVPSFPPGDSAPLERFLREARIAAGFHHPHLCPVFDVGSTGGRHYLTMPIIPGESLAARLKSHRRFAPAEAVRLIATVARAVAVAHVAGVIHRDLKPANIMIGPDGEPVVMDFGLARRTAIGEDGLTSTGIFVGTPAYSSPEQLASEEPLTAAADVYALGAILYELLTGRVPFAGPATELMRRN